MYRIEIFDEKMDFVSACYTDDAQTISIDYLAYDPFQITVQAIEAKKGYFAHITGKSNELVADCIIADVQPDKEQQELSLRPLQALFDVGVFYSPVSDAITWLGNNLTDQFVTNADTLQRRPLNITATAGSRSFPLTGYNLNPTINILSVITNAFATWEIVTEAFLDLSAKEIVVNIFEQVAEQTIECDLDNIISAEITLGDSYGSTNKLTIRKTVEEGTPTGTTEITYYRHTDGSINTTDDDRIVPVFWEVATIEQTSDMTDAQWIQETFTKAKEVLSVGHYDNEVILSVWEDDRIINPRSIEIGTIVTLLLKGETYYSILTGYQVEGSIITLTFGAVRTELTKKLSIQNRGSSSSSSSSGGGGGGGGGGAVTGVKGNEEILYRVGDVNLTPADIGSVPTTTTINGHALSSDVTITKADVGLGNVDNTSDLDKPISDAVQSALDDKVDKETGKGLSTNDFTNALLTKLNGIEAGAQVNKVTGVKGSAESSYRVGNVNITKANIGLGNVDNTSDANKPISTATQTALDGKVDKETGKSLTSNDFTDALLSKLNGIESGAQVNTVTGVKGNSESTYRTGNINITKANIGLGNVDNTSDANKPISTATQTALDNKVDKVTGKGLSTNDFTDALLSKLNGIESGAQVNTVTGVKGNSESSYRVGNVNITKAHIGLGNVDNTKQMPISGGTFTNLDNVFFTASVGSVLFGNQTVSILNSPEAKYVWHDVWAFCRAQTPTYEVTTNGSTWTSATLEKRLFAHQNAWGQSTVLTATQTGARWTWTNGGFAYSSAPWLAIGVCYTNPVAKFDVKLESSSDSFATSTVLVDKQGISANQVPIFVRTNASAQNGLRLTITKNSEATSDSTLAICGLMLLSYRWGNQGKGEEWEHPYTWDANYNLSPLSGSKFVGDLTGNASSATTASSATMATDARALVPTTGRPTSADPDTYGGSRLRHFYASSAMTTNKPPTGDGAIIHLPWDGNNGYDAQIAVKNTDGHLAVRGMNAKVWGTWAEVYDTRHKPSKSDVGLGNVNNTSDLNKPISTATQSALDGKVNTTDIATTSDLGLVKPDGSTITIDADGTIHSMGGSGGGASIYYFYQQTVSVASSAEILRISSGLITANTIVLECTFSNPSAISGDVSWTSYNGYISFTGTCTSATTANVTLADKTN